MLQTGVSLVVFFARNLRKCNIIYLFQMHAPPGLSTSGKGFHISVVMTYASSMGSICTGMKLYCSRFSMYLPQNVCPGL